jgi:hypothetical protein
MEYYSATRNNDMRFEGKWMQLEDIMLSESETQKMHVFSHTWKTEPKINIYTKTSRSYTNSNVEHICNSRNTLGTWGKRERKRE